MKNPYAAEQDDVEIPLGRGAAWASVFVFLLIITLPPLYQNLFEIAKPVDADSWVPVAELFKSQDGDSGEVLATHLRAFDSKLEKAPFTEPPRRAVQGAFTRGPLHEGNRKTRIGEDGWLYFQTALDALTGYGPLTPEPDSVARDPRRASWSPPLAAITHFAAQLEAFGVELLLVPIPVKPTIYPEHLGQPSPAPVTHPDSAAFYTKLNALPNIEVFDLSDGFWKLKKSAQVFLKQDTHWTPAGMEFAAAELAAHLEAKPWFTGDPASHIEAEPPEERASLGDLVEKLDIGTAGFSDEKVVAHPVGGKTRDIASPIVLLGDSFTNIYSAPTLAWGERAGLAEHLALRLGQPLDVIAINGGAATEVRQALADRAGSAAAMREKKIVVWILAARDLFLSATPAHDAKIGWENVQFNDRAPATGVAAVAGKYAKIRATLVSKPPLPDPGSTAYTALLYVAEYRIDAVLEGDIEPEDDGKIAVVHYAFKDRQSLASSTYKIGEQREFDLVPFEGKSGLQSLETRNDSDLFELYWDETAPAPVGGQAIGAAPRLIATGGCAAFALLLGLGLRRAARQNPVVA